MFIKRFLKKEKFDNYDDYVQNAVPVVPENFNFAYDVLDVMANESPDKVAVLWVNDDGEKKSITFKMLSIFFESILQFFLFFYKNLFALFLRKELMVKLRRSATSPCLISYQITTSPSSS